MAGWQRPKFLAQSVQLTHIGHNCKWSGSFDWRLPHTAKARFEASILFFWFKVMFGARKADVPSCFKELLNTDKKLDCIRNARIHNARFLLWTLLVCNPGSAWFCALAMFAPVKFFELWIFHLNTVFWHEIYVRSTMCDLNVVRSALNQWPNNCEQLLARTRWRGSSNVEETYWSTHPGKDCHIVCGDADHDFNFPETWVLALEFNVFMKQCIKLYTCHADATSADLTRA